MSDDRDPPILFQILVPVLAIAWTVAATWYVVVTITPHNALGLLFLWSVAEGVMGLVVAAILMALTAVWWKLTGQS